MSLTDTSENSGRSRPTGLRSTGAWTRSAPASGWCRGSVEAVIDTCALVVAGLRLGLPGDEDDLFDKLRERGVISDPMAASSNG